MNNKIVSIDKINTAAMQLVNNIDVNFLPSTLPKTKEDIEKFIREQSEWIDNNQQIQFLPLNRLNSKQEIAKGLAIMQEIVATGKFTSGKYVEEIEAILGNMYDAHCVSTSSGTDALIVALLSLGIGEGDEVILPLNSFAATENAVFAVGAKPIYINIDMSYNMSYTEIEAIVTKKTKAVIAVCLYGSAKNIRNIYTIVKKLNLYSIVDAAQCFGLFEIINYADILTLSFNPFKNIGTFGKSGALVTRSKTILDLSRMYSYHGFTYNQKNRKSQNWGYNCKMDNMQAAVLKEKLIYFESNSLKRCYLAHRYIKELRSLEKEGKILLPIEKLYNTWHLFPLKLKEVKGSDFISFGKDNGIEFDIYYPLLSTQNNTDYVSEYDFKIDFSKSENIHKHTIHIPLHNHMSIIEQDRIIELLYEYFRKE